VSPTKERPHGLRYSFTLHDPTGNRLMGFDNAHAVTSQGARYRKPEATHDHWHRTASDEGRPYRFTTANQLLLDFETEVARILTERGSGNTVTGESDTPQRGPR
jgi:hypothetical protein